MAWRWGVGLCSVAGAKYDAMVLDLDHKWLSHLPAHLRGDHARGDHADATVGEGCAACALRLPIHLVHNVAQWSGTCWVNSVELTSGLPQCTDGLDCLCRLILWAPWDKWCPATAGSACSAHADSHATDSQACSQLCECGCGVESLMNTLIACGRLLEHAALAAVTVTHTSPVCLPHSHWHWAQM